MTRTEWAMNMTRDEHFNALLDELRKVEYDRFAASDAIDIDTREEAYRRIRCLNDLQSHIESLAMSAAMKEKRWKIL